MTLTIPPRQELIGAAARLDLDRDDHGAVAEYLRHLAHDRAVRWHYLGGYTNTLWASDPGRHAPLAFKNPPAFAFYVDQLLALPGHLIDVSGPLRPGESAVRGNIHKERVRLAKRLRVRRQTALATALTDDIHLEQDGDRVFAEYAPIGHALTLID
jgi:hypothetical protein